MPNATSHRIPSYRKHKPSGQAVVTLNGHDHYLGTHGTAASREAYNRIIQEWLAAGRQLPHGEASLTINELILAYWRTVEPTFRHRPSAGLPGELFNVKTALRLVRELYGRT